MERRTFILGVGSFFVGACASRPRVQPGRNPYAVEAALGPAPAGPRTPPPPPPHRIRIPRAGGSDCVTCAAGGVHYLTQRGDTLGGISARYGVSGEAIVRANAGRIAPSRVTPGRMIWLPGAHPAACEVVTSRTPAPRPASPARPRPTSRGGYRIVARRDWGALPLKSNHDPMNGVRRITLHHTDEVPGIRARGDGEIVSAIQRYHRNQLGWADIGYHYLVGRDGLVYEGRPISAQGAHAGGANNIQNLGIAVIGNFDRKLPSGIQMRALQGFLPDEQRRFDVGSTRLFGHRDLGPTACPGTTLYGWLTRYKAAT